eukprot:scaffold1282_cov251-Pinguiococcus_pyrenoidosus.AAC.25
MYDDDRPEKRKLRICDFGCADCNPALADAEPFLVSGSVVSCPSRLNSRHWIGSGRFSIFFSFTHGAWHLSCEFLKGAWRFGAPRCAATTEAALTRSTRTFGPQRSLCTASFMAIFPSIDREELVERIQSFETAAFGEMCPDDARALLQSCLQNDAQKRPSIPQLLQELFIVSRTPAEANEAAA